MRGLYCVSGVAVGEDGSEVKGLTKSN